MTLDRTRLSFVAVLAGTIAFELAFALPELMPVRLPLYYPLEHRWALEAGSAGLTMSWYGRSLLAALAGLAGFGSTAWIAARRDDAPSAGAIRLWTLAAAIVLASVVLLHARKVAGREPSPRVQTRR